MKLRKFYTYKSKYNHIIIPVTTRNNYWHCKVFYNDNNIIIDQGYYEYTSDGRCLEKFLHHKDVFINIPFKSLSIKEQKAIKEWKKFYKKWMG